MSESAEGKQINIELRSELLIRFDHRDVSFKASVVGVELGEYLILRSPHLPLLRDQIYEGKSVLARWVHSGNVYEFRSEIICDVLHPSLRFLVLSYPKRIEANNQRKDLRVDCYIQAEAECREDAYPAVIVDLGLSGCRLIMKQPSGGDTIKTQLDEEIVLKAPFFENKEYETLTGIVRNCNIDSDRATLGIEFVDMNEKTMDDLYRFTRSILEILA